MSSLAHTTVVVLGGTSGIGLATAKAAQTEGAQVLVTGRSRERLQAAQAELGSGARTVALDVADEAGTRALFEGIGRIDHIFITAGSVALDGAPFGSFKPHFFGIGAEAAGCGRFLTLGACKKLSRKPTRLLAIESHDASGPEAVEQREQQHWIFGSFAACFSLLNQLTRPFHRRSGFGRCIALEVCQYVPERNLKHDLFVA